MMSFALKPQLFKRYRDIALLVFKYGRKKLIQYQKFDQILLDENLGDKDLNDGTPEELVRDLEALGPTFIKLGQMLSTRPDLLSQPYLDALARLQDDVAPFPFVEVEKIIARELGVRMNRAFHQFDPTPIAAASLGQVHRAQLPDGRWVAVKIQRPNIRQLVLDDFEALRQIIQTVDQYTQLGRQYNLSDILDNFHKALLRELDFRQEAENQRTLKALLADTERLVIPTPMAELSSSRVITMEFIRGIKLNTLTPLQRMEHATAELAEIIFIAYLDQVLVHGFFHADPHPGNLLVTEDSQLALLDFGMVATIDPDLQEHLLHLLFAIAEGRGRDAARHCMRIGTCTEAFDERAFTKGVIEVVSYYQKAKAKPLAEGQVVIELTRVSAESGLQPVPELALLGKALLNLDEVTRDLDPHFNPTEVLRLHGEAIMRKRMVSHFAPSRLLASLVETQRLTRQLPDRVNNVLEAMLNGDFELKVNALDEVQLTESLQKIANRIAVGLVLAALIIGAAMIMQVQSTLTIWGYPALAMVMFSLATGCGFYLVFSILLKDRQQHRRRRRS